MNTTQNPDSKPKSRPCIGLALSGGGPRGLAHIGVLRVLEREHIPVDVLAGTSVGGIVAAGYAAGLNSEDLEKKVQMLRLLGQQCGTCFQRCVGMDALNAVYLTTYEIDKKHGTAYHSGFIEYVKEAETHDWVIDGCMTDPKGDRSKRPSEQPDADVFVHVVEQRKNGVIIRGAKAHQTGAVNSHEHLVMPTLAMRSGPRQ